MTISASMWTSALPVRFKLLTAIAALTCVAATDAPLVGMWGAGDALLALDAQGGRLQVGCSLVRFAPVRPGADGRFSTSAQVEQISIMPRVSEGDDDAELPEPAERPATLSGRIGGGSVDLSLAIDGQPPRALHLMLGQRSNPARCL